MAQYSDVLNELSKLSLMFQKDDVSIADVVDGVHTSIQVLEDLATTDGPQLIHLASQLSGRA